MYHIGVPSPHTHTHTHTTYRLSAQRSFRLIQILCTALTLTSLEKRDHLTEFLCHDVSCQLLTESTLTHPPVLAQIGGVLNEVSTMTNCDGFQWVQSSREDASLNDGGAILYTVATRWSYGVVKHSELQGEQVHSAVCVCVCACV